MRAYEHAGSGGRYAKNKQKGMMDQPQRSAASTRSRCLHTCGGSAAQGGEGEHQGSGRREAHHLSMLVSFVLGVVVVAVVREVVYAWRGGWLGFDLFWR